MSEIKTTPLTRVCSICGVEKPSSAFSKNRSARDGLRSHCTECRYPRRREYLLKQRFGITESEYHDLLEKQHGACALCGSSDPKGRWDRLHVDHDHQTGRVRGLLCFWCNTALGKLGDDAESLLRAYRYVAGQEWT